MPKEKRVFGYFALPVLVGDDIVAALDLKTDRKNRKLLMQKWTWVGNGKKRAARKELKRQHRGRAASFRAVSARGVSFKFFNKQHWWLRGPGFRRRDEGLRLPVNHVRTHELVFTDDY